MHGLSGNSPAILFEDRADFDAAGKAAAAKDQEGWKILIAGRGTMIPSGTKARKLDSAFMAGGVQVRVMDGPHAGFAGWTFKECLASQ